MMTSMKDIVKQVYFVMRWPNFYFVGSIPGIIF